MNIKSEKRKILITGSTGMLGKNLKDVLTSKCLNISTHGFSNEADYQEDLRFLEGTLKMLEKDKPDIIINLVAMTNVDQCEVYPNDAYLINTKVVENLSLGFKKVCKFKLIQISTDQVYDEPGPHSEDDIRLMNFYAYSKYCAEKVAASIGGVILRTNFFGRSLVPGRLSFSDWLIESFRNRNKIKLFEDVYFSPLSMETLISCIEKVIKSPKSGVYNLGSSDGMNKMDFALKLGKHLGLDISNSCSSSVNEMNLKAYRPTDMRMNSNKFESTYQISLPSLKEEIEKQKL